MGSATDYFRYRWNNYKCNDRKYLRVEACLQEHLFEHFNSKGHNGFLYNISVTVIHKTDGKNPINDTHRERLVFHSIQYRDGWLAASDLFHMFTQSIKFYTFHYQCRCLKNVVHQIDSKNGWLLLSASFTAKFGLVFVLTLENAFS